MSSKTLRVFILDKRTLEILQNLPMNEDIFVRMAIKKFSKKIHQNNSSNFQTKIMAVV